MGLGTELRRALEAARVGTESIHSIVQHEVWLSQSTSGDPVFADPASYSAMVQEGALQHIKSDGTVVSVRARISFFPDPDTGVPPAINPRDQITLPSGFVGKIVDIREGLDDPDTLTQLVRNVWLE